MGGQLGVHTFDLGQGVTHSGADGLSRPLHLIAELPVPAAQSGGRGKLADERIAAGATLVQAYTGFIYGGPRWPRRLQDGLAARVRAAGLTSVSEARGTEVAPRR